MKTIELNGKEHKISLTLLTCLLYKEEFKRDLILDLSLIEGDLVTMAQILYAMIKTNDRNAYESFIQFAENTEQVGGIFSEEMMKDFSDVIEKSSIVTTKSKKEGKQVEKIN